MPKQARLTVTTGKADSYNRQAPQDSIQGWQMRWQVCALLLCSDVKILDLQNSQDVLRYGRLLPLVLAPGYRLNPYCGCTGGDGVTDGQDQLFDSL